jgi:BatD DUF11 like domain
MTASMTALMAARTIAYRHAFASLSRATLAMAWLLCLALCALPLHAQNRAFFDRDRIALDETVLLTIQVEGMTQGPPDFGEFLRDFRIVNLTTEPQMEMVNGRMSVRIRLLLELQPTREGVIDVPPFRVGGETVGPFRLTVLPPRNAPSTAPPPQAVSEDGPPVMLQSIIEAGPAYVQQSVGYVVRLYFEPSKLIDGKLDQAPPQGASLLRVGDDVESNRMIDGRQFRVIERRFLVVPNRPGRVQVPAPKFEGRGIFSVFDDIFGNGGGGRGAIKVSGEARSVQVRPIPANAPQPWLPVRSVTLRYLAAERAPRVGEATKVTVEMVVDGANAVMLPELQLKVDGDAQVFPEPAQTDEGFVDDRPRARMVREFSIVPAKSGALRVAGPRLVWWDVQAGVARTASLPDLRFDVAPTTGSAMPVPAKGGVLAGARPENASDGKGLLERFVRDPIGITTIATLAVLWAMTLAWAWRLWSERRRGRMRNAASAPVVRGYDAFAYKRLFDSGTLAEIAAALCAMAQPAAKDLDQLRTMLDDPAQRAAIDALQRARWSDGAIIETRAQLRSAFADGPRLRSAHVSRTPSMLPPLYPEA